jgi:aminoglycoside 3-N-acetyltransferase
MTAYCRADLTNAYKKIGLRRGMIIYITGNLGRLGFPVDDQGMRVIDKQAIARMHIEVLENILGPEGTIVFPTHSWGEVGAESVFDPFKTPCDYLLSQHFLNMRECRRQVHPFASIAATGHKADHVISNGLSRHVHGQNTPMAYLAEQNALHVSVGMPVARTITAVHHCEQIAQVPYRYVKAFRKNIRLNGHVRLEEVYLHVLYRKPEIVLERDGNRKILALAPVAAGLAQTPLGRSFVESVSLGIFVTETISAMKRDPYIWLRSIAGDRPWMR